jgi:hypothetical protein
VTSAYSESVGRLKYLGRPPRLVAVILVAAIAALVVSFFVLHGTPPGHTRVGHGSIAFSRNRPIDFFRVGLDIAAVVAILFAFVRWNDAREARPHGDQERHYGDSIVDARTSVDPAIGMRPVNSDPQRR